MERTRVVYGKILGVKNVFCKSEERILGLTDQLRNFIDQFSASSVFLIFITFTISREKTIC